MLWKLAIVQELIAGSDDKIRAAIVRVPDTRNLLKRSVKHLIPLEVSSHAETTEARKPEENVRQPVEAGAKLRRRAAMDGELLRRLRS